MDDLADKLTRSIVNDELKLSHDGVYDREIGIPIRDCQQRFFKTLYTYRGEE